MFYVLSAAVAGAGLIVLVLALVRLAGAARGFGRAAEVMRSDVESRLGMLRARAAAVGVAVRDLRTRRVRIGSESASEPVRSGLNE
ncbi:hypothetical protein LY15_000169 [Prauserella flava]|uniref:Uncharacterized protein n=1 Tax=Prauserella sediminis TaxID=577680 RepID=A0A839XR40_9PSEU|nr:hypothetical protein [Prauserella sediminis]MCR3718208.1 hypothetical protein [Prauserella flava]MCR3732778.1 hypothetical protein [Prauserella salsuginis]